MNEYTSVGGTGYEYDAAGNLTKDADRYYFWDYENRLTKAKRVTDNSDVAEYAYTANMRRIEKVDYTQDPAVTTRFYSDNWSDIEERTWDGEAETLTASYVNGPRIDEYVTMDRGGNTYWYLLTPIVGNVAALLNSSGAIQEGYKYDAYGKALVLTGSGDDETWFTADDATDDVSALRNPFTFTGRRLDPETMWMYFRFRPYDTLNGRFGSRDPLMYVDGMNLFEYARGRVSAIADTSGRGGPCQDYCLPPGWRGAFAVTGFQLGDAGHSTPPTGKIEGAAAIGGLLIVGVIADPLLPSLPDYQGAMKNLETIIKGTTGGWGDGRPFWIWIRVEYQECVETTCCVGWRHTVIRKRTTDVPCPSRFAPYEYWDRNLFTAAKLVDCIQAYRAKFNRKEEL